MTRTGDIQTPTAQRVNAFLNDKQLTTLAATVALANFTNRFNRGPGIELP